MKNQLTNALFGLVSGILLANGTALGQAPDPPPASEGGGATPSVADVAVSDGSLEGVSLEMQERLDASLRELAELRASIVEQNVPLSRRLSELESELQEARDEYQRKSRLQDSRALGLASLTTQVNAAEQAENFLANLLRQYVTNWQSRLPIGEIQRYEAELAAARNAPEDATLDDRERFEAQAALVLTAIDRIDDAIGGSKFRGYALDDSGLRTEGTYVVVGPSQFFRSADGTRVGNVELKANSREPSIVTFNDPLDADAAERVITSDSGLLPFDPSLGNARVIETLDETVTEHILRGGPVVWPILGLAAAALLAAIGKWISLSLVPSPSRKRIDALLQCVEEGRLDAAKEAAAGIRGPTGEMLAAGVALIGKPVELLEEVMYERVLVTRLKVQRLLPFIAISAAAAPLLGLLGTVTGIISTFKLITVFGTGDVKTLSGGISEALITTELGLIAAIPALLVHAYLSRKAKGITDRMEQSALSLVNGVAIGQPDPRDAGSDQARTDASSGGGRDASAAESARDALVELLGPLLEERRGSDDSKPTSDPA